jgi:predicted amidohydrolase YtcJ
LDGSLDTAWFTQPYTQNPPGKTGAFSGYQQIPDEVLDAVFDKYWASDLQIHMHMNGDAAADQALSAIAKAVKKHGMRDHRPVFVHAALVRVDQIEKIKTYGAIPSFLTAGITTGGDAVVRLWGKERAAIALASRTFLRNGLPFTFSHDAPVTPVPSILALVDAGVNRISASGQVVGPEETIPPYHALRAVTAMAAYQLKLVRYAPVRRTSSASLTRWAAARLTFAAGSTRNVLRCRPFLLLVHGRHTAAQAAHQYQQSQKPTDSLFHGFRS